MNNTWSIWGHDVAVGLLQQTIAPASQQRPAALRSSENGRDGPRHAYLLLGARHIGKTTLATAFARALLCNDMERRPCGECRSCRLMSGSNHPDFRLVQPLDREGEVDRSNGMLRVEQATELVHEAALSPVESRHKFFLIQDIHRANDSFANKLLKTLEEPPDPVVLCLTAPDRHGLLPTIVSRCQVIELRLLDTQLIEKALMTTWHVESARAQILARLAGGRLGWAVQQSTDADAAARRAEQLQRLQQLIAGTSVQRLKFAESVAAQRTDQHLFAMLELWTTWWRDVMLAQADCLNACCNVDQQDEIVRQARALSPRTVQDYIHVLKRIEGYLQHTTNTRLALDVLLLRLPQIRS